MTIALTAAQLLPHEVATIKLIARGYSNEEVARRLGLKTETLRSRLPALYRRLGIDVSNGHTSSVMARVQLVVWAFENGLGRPEPLPADLTRSLLEVCRSIAADQPRGDLRRLALEALEVNGERPMTHRRGRPVSVPRGADSASEGLAA
jgi:hypothetical protein